MASALDCCPCQTGNTKVMMRIRCPFASLMERWLGDGMCDFVPLLDVKQVLSNSLHGLKWFEVQFPATE